MENNKKTDQHGENYSQPPFAKQAQTPPGTEQMMRPKPDHGEDSYQGSGVLANRKAIITGGDSGIGKAVAIAFAREGADLLLVYLSEEEEQDALETKYLIEQENRQAILMRGDLKQETFCKQVIDEAIAEWGKIDILINNAAYQMTYESFAEISSAEWNKTFDTNVHAMFFMCQYAIPHMVPGSTIINTSSINAYEPNPGLLPYALTKGTIQHFTYALNLQLSKEQKGIRVNCVAPGPVWTPLIPSTIPDHDTFGADNPMERPAQPAELAPSYVFLASVGSSYIAGATIPVTGGRNTL
ncbi:SDR family oxidoreductase [Sphingobacterium sp. UT-1RO-CII-1]|uniref:SDR family oxidoreductase n=1 Tax=Sphingobacterium sp. UT-1RO-CII-1 TaxID=2995225 RepID=UPI00227C161C|nr:SDR family oxidoreductase [Sphingobacterium sp. UT-1RO-CII-1]MCY4780629.1 SDR family oxidoreductase [Sphingobacterium sp. UT-1RO-CII-1]